MLFNAIVAWCKTLALIVIIILPVYIESNKKEIGHCYSSALENERIKRRVIDWLEITIGRVKALRCIRQYYRQEKKFRLSYKEANQVSCEFVSEMIALVNSKYPNNGFYNSKRDIVLTSSVAKRKAASKEYNGRAMTNGTTQISYAYFELWNTNEEIPEDIKEDLLANVFLHEAGHHVFRLFTGMHIPNNKIRFVSYIDECFADLKCYSMMDKTSKEAAVIMRYKYEKVICAKDNDKCTKSHPSNNFRIKTSEKGVFITETVRAIAEYINETKGKGYIPEELIEEVFGHINAYSQRHPETDLFFCLRYDTI